MRKPRRLQADEELARGPQVYPSRKKSKKETFEKALSDLTQGNEKLQDTVKQLRTSTVSYCALNLEQGLSQIEKALDSLNALGELGQ